MAESEWRLRVLLYPNGRYVAIDLASGGYPYATLDVQRAKDWASNLGERERYAEMFPAENFRPATVIYSVVPE